MALMITDECINCDVCEPECPNEAISHGPGDLRDRPGALHRVRRPLRRAAVRAGVPGRLHPGRSGARRIDARRCGPSTGACRPKAPASATLRARLAERRASRALARLSAPALLGAARRRRDEVAFSGRAGLGARFFLFFARRFGAARRPGVRSALERRAGLIAPPAPRRSSLHLGGEAPSRSAPTRAHRRAARRRGDVRARRRASGHGTSRVFVAAAVDRSAPAAARRARERSDEERASRSCSWRVGRLGRRRSPSGVRRPACRLGPRRLARVTFIVARSISPASTRSSARACVDAFSIVSRCSGEGLRST